MKNMYYERQYHQKNLSEDNSRFVLSIFEVINGKIHVKLTKQNIGTNLLKFAHVLQKNFKDIW